MSRLAERKRKQHDSEDEEEELFPDVQARPQSQQPMSGKKRLCKKSEKKFFMVSKTKSLTRVQLGQIFVGWPVNKRSCGLPR